MAHFYATATGRAATTAGRIGTIKTGVRASAASYDAGISVLAKHNSVEKADFFFADFDGGSGGNARAGAVRYWYDGENSHVAPNAEFLMKITDQAWEDACKEQPDLVTRLKRLVFFNMDKLP